MVKVLIIDDQVEENFRLTRHLTAQGHEVFSSVTGREGLELAEKVEPDIIIFDLIVVDMDGFAICEHIRAHPRLKDAGIISLTHQKGFQILDDILRKGANTVVTRPFKLEVISRKIAELKGQQKPETAFELKAPKVLQDAYNRLVEGGRRLGDVAEIFNGVAYPDRRRYISEVKRDERWQPILRQKNISSFGIKPADMYLLYEPRKLVSCPPEELMDSEKVVLRRTAPPYTASVDSEGFIIDISLYGIVPAEGLLCEYIAAYLNSRIMDFFIRRIRPLQALPELTTMLRLPDIEAIPIIIPGMKKQLAIAKLVRDLEDSISIRGPGITQAKLLIAINKAIFSALKFSKEEVVRLGQLHF